ncbi:hypothetical protein [Paenarthrobacter sp.]|uniref:hypothetical protein n=1 Tax=Paenarthrobacter sp. TaxID=1931993 RepID=UPI0028128D8F|nr:hypothetical protein [Paenarthrobacter sp.]
MSPSEISDEAVEAAAKRAWLDSELGRRSCESWAALDPLEQATYRLYAAGILNAAAPFIAAQAPSVSPKVTGNTPPGQIRELLKHLDSWESQEHKTVTIAYLRRHFKDAA